MLRQAVHNSPQICQFGGLQLRAVMALTRWMAKVSGGGVVQVLCWGLGILNDPDKAADMHDDLGAGHKGVFETPQVDGVCPPGAGKV